MENFLDNSLFMACDLLNNLPNANPSAPQADLDAWVAECRHTVTNYQVLKNTAADLFHEPGTTYNDRLYTDAMSLFRKAETMCRIQSFWTKEDDCCTTDTTDYWLRAKDYLSALYTMPTDQLPTFFPTLSFRGYDLTYTNTAAGLHLCKGFDFHTMVRGFNNAFPLKMESMVIPFDPHSIWDALLLMLSVQWMWLPRMWFTIDIALPRVTIYDNRALATFYSVSAQPMEDTGLFPLHKNGVLLCRNEDTFSIEGAYRVYMGRTDKPNLPAPPKHIPPFHIFTPQEQRLFAQEQRRLKETPPNADDLPF